MSDWFTDLRHGARMIVKRPGTSAIAVLALSLGIGLTTVMFSIVQGVMLRGLPFPEGDRIMRLVTVPRENRENSRSTSLADLADWRARVRTLDALAAYTEHASVLSGDDRWSERYQAARITPNLLAVLRVAPLMGRDLRESDAAPAAPPVVLISHRVWQTRYESRPDIVGAVVRLNGTPTTIVGVMPAKFEFPDSAGLWTPLDVTPGARRGDGQRVRVVGRLSPGVAVAGASAELTGIAAALEQAHVENKGLEVRVRPFLDEELPEQIAETFMAMLAAVFGVMLIACVNVTNLQFARAAERTKEVAIRAALGSSRWRIVRRLLAEGLILSALGAAVALAFAHAGTRYFMHAIAETSPPFWIDVRVDPVVLLFVAGLAIAATLVSSVIPGWRLARADTNATLKDDARGTTSLRMGRVTRGLIVVEVAVSCVLLVVSGLMVRSILDNSRLAFPFATEDILQARTVLDSDAFDEGDPLARGLTALEESLSRIPGVRAVALTDGLPGRAASVSVHLDGVAYSTEDEVPRAARIAAGARFFDVLRVAPIAGRGFLPTDAASSERVAVVDTAFVSRHLSGAAPLGRRIRFGRQADAPWHTVVGVVPALGGVDQRGDRATVYVPLAQSPSRVVRPLLSTTGDPLALTSAARAAASVVHERLALDEPMTLAADYWREGWPFRLFGGLFTAFGLAALMLAAVGLYGVMAFSVRRRTQEIGVRLALGATRQGIVTLVLRQGLTRVVLGSLLGLWPAWFLATQMTALVEDQNPADPVVYGVTLVTLFAAGLMACLVPAWRASSIDPLAALRED